MKKLLLILSCLFLIIFAYSQVVNIPEATKKNFSEKYPKAKEVKWSNNVTNYTASFSTGDNKLVAHYHLDGTWKYTEKFIEKSALPKQVMASYQKSRIASLDYLSSALIENSHKEKAYRLEAKNGVEKIFLFFDKNGKELKSMRGL